MRLAVLAAVSLVLCGTAAAEVDPVATAMQQSLKRALQVKLGKQVPGIRVTAVRCTVTKDVTKGRCRADFAYRTVRGYYRLVVVQPAKGPPSYTSTSVRCFDAKTGTTVSC